MVGPVIVVHGGAGRARRGLEAEVHAGLAAAVHAGHAALAAGATALDAVAVAVVALEDAPAFNAGRGSVLAEDGRVEMDASVMEGTRRRAGGVAAVRGVKNPVEAARALLEEGRHVLLAADGALAFARERGLELRDDAYFVTERRRGAALGTVGAVALDRGGHLAAATSTGGTTNKRAGRVGDSPLIGAGTFADDASVAVSCTGHGEAIMRAVAAHDVHARVRYGGGTLDDAAAAVVARLDELGGPGGLIAVSRSGEVAMPFTTEVMNRGWRADGGPARTAIGRA